MAALTASPVRKPRVLPGAKTDLTIDLENASVHRHHTRSSTTLDFNSPLHFAVETKLLTDVCYGPEADIQKP